MAAFPGYIEQAASIPIHAGRICLVTARSGKRWTIPKGHLEPGKTAAQIALQEAWEEAGLSGILHAGPLGSYCYNKLGNSYHVAVFLMHVTEIAREWPERNERERRWYRPLEAQAQIEYAGLRHMLLLLARERSWADVYRIQRDLDRAPVFSETSKPL